MKTGPDMGGKSSAELTLFLLLVTALCLQADVFLKFYSIDTAMNWTEARRYCQREHLDLVDLNLMWVLFDLVVSPKIWIGLHRDPENDSVWRQINLTGEGISGMDMSGNGNWKDGAQSSHCGYLQEGVVHSEPCSQKHKYTCFNGNDIIKHMRPRDWEQAREECQKENADLVTLNEINNYEVKFGWIGLYRKGGDTWSWIGNLTSNYNNWTSQEPITADCGSLGVGNEELDSEDCSETLPFVCFNDNLVVVNESKTWEDALIHCREMQTPCAQTQEHCGYDLMSLTDRHQYRYVKNRINRATTDELWIGLRFLGGDWWWLNGQKPDHEDALPDCPSDWKHCGTVSKHHTNNWIIRDCSERRNFICSKK